MTRRQCLIAVVFCVLCLCSCASLSYTSKDEPIRVGKNGFLIVDSGDFDSPVNVKSYSNEGKQIDSKSFDSFYHIAGEKDDDQMMLASVRKDKILSVRRNGNVKMFTLPLQHPYNTYIDIEKVGNNNWAVTLNGDVESPKGNNGVIVYFDNDGNVTSKEVLDFPASFLYISKGLRREFVLRSDLFGTPQIDFLLRKERNYERIASFNLDKRLDWILRECVAYTRIYCYGNKFTYSKSDNTKSKNSLFGVLDSKSGKILNPTIIRNPDAIISSAQAALISSTVPGYLHILTKDGHLFSSKPKECVNCMFMDIDSLGEDVYVMYYKDKIYGKCYISKWDKSSNKLNSAISINDYCGYFIAVRK